MTCYEVLKIVSEKDKDCLENVKNISLTMIEN